MSQRTFLALMLWAIVVGIPLGIIYAHYQIH